MPCPTEPGWLWNLGDRETYFVRPSNVWTASCWVKRGRLTATATAAILRIHDARQKEWD